MERGRRALPEIKEVISRLLKKFKGGCSVRESFGFSQKEAENISKKIKKKSINFYSPYDLQGKIEQAALGFSWFTRCLK